MTRFRIWLALTARDQRDVYGLDGPLMDDVRWADYVRTNFLAAHTELSEALAHIPWKPYRVEVGRPKEPERTLAVRELIDVLFHVSNLLVALGVDDAELENEYERKAIINRTRNVIREEK